MIPRPAFDLAAFYQAAARSFSDRAEQLERAVARRNRGIREYQRRMRAALRVIDANGLTAAYLLAYREEPSRAENGHAGSDA